MLGGIVLVGVIVGSLGSWIVEKVSDDADADDDTSLAVYELRDEVRQLRALVEERTDSPDR
jgi:voltage-gated potassium channel